MAALPPGWCSTSITGTVTLSLALELKAQTVVGTVDARVDHLEFQTVAAAGATDLSNPDLWDGTGSGAASWSTVEVEMTDRLTGITTTLAGISGAGSASGEPGWLPAIAIEKSWSNLRLGVTIQEGALRYAWFEDAASVVTYTVGGSAVATFPGADPPSLTADGWQGIAFGTLTPFPGQGPIISFEAAPVVNALFPEISGQTRFDHVRFGSFVGAGVALTPPFAASFKLATVSSDDPFRRMAHMFGAPYRATLDLAVVDADGSAAAAGYAHDEAGAGTTPATPTARTDLFDGSGYSGAALGHVVTAAQLADPWLSAQTVRPYDADLPFRFEGQAPRHPGNTAPSHYSVGTITIASPVNVLNSTTAWTSDLGGVAIGGTPTVPVFTVTSEPVRVIRTLAAAWRRWNNPADPDFESDDNYTTTKHDFYPSGAGDDAWGWGLYSYLELDLTVPAGDDTPLAVTLTWAVPLGGAGEGPVDTIETTYSLDWQGNPLTFPAGMRSTRRIDLMMPVEQGSRPFYGERVDEIRILGLKVGVTTLHAITLVTDQDAYLTLSGRKHQTGDGTEVFTGIVLAQDGTAPALLWGRDTAVSPPGAGDGDGDGFPDFRGDHQNGKMLIDGVTIETTGRAPGMQAGTLAATLEELSRMEGITASSSASALDAALTDADGNTLGIDENGLASPVVRAADWFLPVAPPARVSANTPYDVRAQVVAAGVVIPPGLSPAQMVLFQRNRLGMSLEALAVDADFFRHGAGVTVTARGYTGGAPAEGDPLLGTDTTDASGYAWMGVRTGTIGGQDINHYLT